jgi:hypothetical protein
MNWSRKIVLISILLINIFLFVKSDGKLYFLIYEDFILGKKLAKQLSVESNQIVMKFVQMIKAQKE